MRNRIGIDFCSSGSFGSVPDSFGSVLDSRFFPGLPRCCLYLPCLCLFGTGPPYYQLLPSRSCLVLSSQPLHDQATTIVRLPFDFLRACLESLLCLSCLTSFSKPSVVIGGFLSILLSQSNKKNVCCWQKNQIAFSHARRALAGEPSRVAVHVVALQGHATVIISLHRSLDKPACYFLRWCLEDEHIIKGTFGKALRANSQIPIGYLLIRGELIFFQVSEEKWFSLSILILKVMLERINENHFQPQNHFSRRINSHRESK
jgi:hypothetical protein